MQTILIVEDDKTIAESICFILEKDSFNCKWFDNGESALNYHKDNEVDLMLLDVGLPDMSGFDLLRKVREKSNIPVIIISARDDESDQVLGLEGLGEINACPCRNGGTREDDAFYKTSAS